MISLADISQGYHSVLDFLGSHMLSCPTKLLLGIDCPGCGLQRSLLLLLRGELHESVRLYPAAIPLLLMVLLLAIHARFRLTHGAMILQYIFIFNVALIFISYIIRHL